MTTKRMTCLHCGFEGEMEVQGLDSDVSALMVFRYLGDNPVSGHMHYQCPACDIVHLVDPTSVFDGQEFSFSFRFSERKGVAEGLRTKLPQMGTMLYRLFQNQGIGYH